MALINLSLIQTLKYLIKSTKTFQIEVDGAATIDTVNGELTVTIPYVFDGVNFNVLLTPFGINADLVGNCYIKSKSAGSLCGPGCVQAYPTIVIALLDFDGNALNCFVTEQIIQWVAIGKKAL